MAPTDNNEAMSAPRVPPRQQVTRKFPVVGERVPTPEALDVRQWRLRITGEVEQPQTWTYDELMRLPQQVMINATGYGARALWKDESIVPVRGQIAWLIPQLEVNYGVFYKGIQILSRRDGIAVQDGGTSEMDGYNDDNEQPDRQKAEADVRVAAELFTRMRS